MSYYPFPFLHLSIVSTARSHHSPADSSVYLLTPVHLPNINSETVRRVIGLEALLEDYVL